MDKKTIICFSFDDGRIDNYFLAKDFLLPKGIPATFNITTGYVDGSAPRCIDPCKIDPMSIENVKWIASNRLFEVALHGDKHKNTPEDVETGRQKLCEWLELPSNTDFGFASPSSAFSNSDKKANKNYFEGDFIKYVRIGDNTDCSSFRKSRKLNTTVLKIVSEQGLLGRAMNHFIDTLFYRERAAYLENCGNFMRADNCGHYVHAMTIYKGTAPEVIIYLVKKAIRQNRSIILMMHSVNDNQEDTDKYTYRMRDFEMICDYLIKQRNKGNLEIKTVSELVCGEKKL